MKNKRIQPCVEALEAKVALSTASAHLGSAAMAVEKAHVVHVEALSKPVTITGTYKIHGSSTSPIVTLTTSSFKLPTLGTVSIIGTESTSTSAGVVVNTLRLYNGSNFFKMSVTPGLYFPASSTGTAFTTSHTYTVLPNGKDGTGTIDFSLQANSAFTMKFIPA